MPELTPAVLIRFCECKTNQRGLIRPHSCFRKKAWGLIKVSAQFMERQCPAKFEKFSRISPRNFFEISGET